jgi:hypothetical protein
MIVMFALDAQLQIHPGLQMDFVTQKGDTIQQIATGMEATVVKLHVGSITQQHMDVVFMHHFLAWILPPIVVLRLVWVPLVTTSLSKATYVQTLSLLMDAIVLVVQGVNVKQRAKIILVTIGMKTISATHVT